MNNKQIPPVSSPPRSPSPPPASSPERSPSSVHSPFPDDPSISELRNNDGTITGFTIQVNKPEDYPVNKPEDLVSYINGKNLNSKKFVNEETLNTILKNAPDNIISDPVVIKAFMAQNFNDNLEVVKTFFQRLSILNARHTESTWNNKLINALNKIIEANTTVDTDGPKTSVLDYFSHTNAKDEYNKNEYIIKRYIIAFWDPKSISPLKVLKSEPLTEDQKKLIDKYIEDLIQTNTIAGCAPVKAIMPGSIIDNNHSNDTEISFVQRLIDRLLILQRDPNWDRTIPHALKIKIKDELAKDNQLINKLFDQGTKQGLTNELLIQAAEDLNPDNFTPSDSTTNPNEIQSDIEALLLNETESIGNLINALQAIDNNLDNPETLTQIYQDIDAIILKFSQLLGDNLNQLVLYLNKQEVSMDIRTKLSERVNHLIDQKKINTKES